MTIVCLALIAFIVFREVTQARERANLLQRIQAPEQAVAEHSRRDRPVRRSRAISLDDDRAMIEARERRNAAAEDES